MRHIILAVVLLAGIGAGVAVWATGDPPVGAHATSVRLDAEFDAGPFVTFNRLEWCVSVPRNSEGIWLAQ